MQMKQKTDFSLIYSVSSSFPESYVISKHFFEQQVLVRIVTIDHWILASKVMVNDKNMT